MSPSADDQTPEEEPSEGGEPRRHPSTIGGLTYLGVLALTCIGMVVAAIGPWRSGVRIIAVALAVAAAARLVLTQQDAGMLAVRARWFDTLLLAATAVVLWFLAGDIPAI